MFIAPLHSVSQSQYHAKRGGVLAYREGTRTLRLRILTYDSPILVADMPLLRAEQNKARRAVELPPPDAGTSSHLGPHHARADHTYVLGLRRGKKWSCRLLEFLSHETIGKIRSSPQSSIGSRKGWNELRILVIAGKISRCWTKKRLKNSVWTV